MLQDEMLRTIQKFRMIEKGETVFVAVSGGCDSVTLLHLLNEIKGLWRLNLAILHANHGLRGRASREDERFLRRLAKRLKLAIFVGQLAVRQKAKAEHWSLEEAGRHLRYEFFERVAETKGAAKIAVAHTQDDQAETVLMRILTGTGLEGLRAIRPKLKREQVWIVRPLIEIPEARIRAFAMSQAIGFREDSSNRSLGFLRNRIRLKLLPLLERSFNPQVKQALARLPHLLDVDLAFLEDTAELFYKRLAQTRSDEIGFPRESFAQLRPSIQFRLLERASRVLKEAELDFDHWNEFIGRFATERSFRLQFPKRLLAVVSPDSVKIRRNVELPVSFSYSLFPDEPLYLSELHATCSCQVEAVRPKVIRKTDKSFEWFDRDKVSFPITVRNRRPGDRFQPLGQDHSLKLKGFLINRHVPMEERDHVPLLLSEGHIIWVGGVALGERAKVTGRTRRFLQISFERGSV